MFEILFVDNGMLVANKCYLINDQWKLLLMTWVIIMEHTMDRRQYTRVDISLDIRLDFGVRRYRHFANNLSLNGIYVKGFCQG